MPCGENVRSRPSRAESEARRLLCPKYRRRMLVNGADSRLKQIIAEVAEEMRSILPDRGHAGPRPPLD